MKKLSKRVLNYQQEHEKPAACTAPLPSKLNMKITKSYKSKQSLMQANNPK